MSGSPNTGMMCDSESDSDGIVRQESDGNLWLDEQCLEPITSVPGCSQLCNACLLVLRRCESKEFSDDKLVFHRHLRYRTTLRSSAERGCLLCIYLLDEWKGSGDEYKSTALVRSKAIVAVGDPGVIFQCSMSELSVVFYLVDAALDPMTRLKDRLKCSPSTSSPESQFLAGSWLQHCLEFHADCRPDTEQSKKIPARLINIRLTNHAPTLRLIETGGQLREERHYMTLSYCWGDALFPTLRTDNEQQLKNGIAFETLPKAFQDTIHIAGWFQVTYLWIDSLCIIQDSHDDWIRESCKMKDIYSNSFLTVAATGATDPSKGCFHDRIPSLVEPIKYRVSNETAETMAIFDKSSLQKAIHSSPLSKRAWAFQERLLSPRVLHFGEKQLLWECNEISACETCPGGIQPNPSDTFGQFSPSLVAKGQLMSRHKDFLAEVWTPIVNSYSMGALTKFSDKCLAFSGIADEAQSLYGGSYVAGLWRKNFQVQLLWRKDNGRFQKLDRYGSPMVHSYKRPITYVAPSWSWLSVDAPIVFSPNTKLHVLLEIVDIKIELSNNNPFGTIRSGRLQARGWLSVGTWEAWKTGEEPMSQGMLRSIGGHPCDRHNRVEMDTEVKMEEVICLLVGSNTLQGDEDVILDGLVLAKTDANADEYRRIGAFFIYQKFCNVEQETCRRLFQRRLENGEWEDLPKSTFTIV